MGLVLLEFISTMLMFVVWGTFFCSTASVRLGMGHCFVKLGKMDKARYALGCFYVSAIR